ncbi:uncharacterized protein [Blastocystis hominis]|uniref:CR-type domain-containing protein n=1 Tax=Blastocystis hominis TaxID=12968 RepID=D8M3I6_BLAHO|nr:uncharacterized protein [Blastocystis hominis]CBK22459.2 unnamed protein product [Blastocystis hominis]|eukprot:XP_012896507.1 uncharacterized protein [Blastocystis hominis]
MSFIILVLLLLYPFCSGTHSLFCLFFRASALYNGSQTVEYHVTAVEILFSFKLQDCQTIIDSHISGYCFCGENWRSSLLKINHPPTTCFQECRKCVGWRATEGCSPYSKRDETHDLPCEAVVPSSLPGYCLCENGRRTAFSDCRHPPFTCQKLCASLPRSDCPLFDSSLRSNSAKGCSGSVTLQNRMKESVQVMWVSDVGTEALLSEIHPIGSYTISGVCVPFSFRVYGRNHKLLFQRSLQSADSLHFPITDCYEEPQPLAQALSYSLRSKGASIDFRWPLRSEAKQARDERFTMGISVESMYRDLNQTFTWSRDIDCPYCKAELNRNGLPCRRCNGKGTERVAHRGVTMEFECPLCHGVGRVSKRSSFSCPYCNVLFFIRPRLIDRIRMFSTKW